MNKRHSWSNHVKAIYSILAFLTIWCTWNTVKSGNLLSSVLDIKSNSALLSREVGNTIDRLQNLEQKATETIKEEVEKVKNFDAENLIKDALGK